MNKYCSLLLLSLLLSISSLFAQTCMQLGVGLSGPAYWENGENPFIDQMKYRGDWISFNASGSSPWDTGVENEIPLDSVGYPNAGIPYNTSSGGLQKVRIVVSASHRVTSGVQYAFLYDGYGEFRFYGMTVDTAQPGRIVVTVTGTGNVWINMDSSSVAPNHARNFRLVPLAEEATYQQDLFRPIWLDRVREFHTVRFMDWFHTNNNPCIDWGDRSTPNSYRQSDSAGVCYEYAIELCNRTGVRPWVCIPAMADSNYIVNMARMWRNRLDSSLDIYVEYSNEVWNFQFQQTQWIQQNTTWLPSHWPLNTRYDSNLNWAENEGKMQGWAINTFRREWGADTNRVHRVLGTQAVNAWVSRNVIEGANRQFDYLSPAWYFGTSTSQSAAFGPGTTPEQVIDTCRANFFVRHKNNFKQHYTISDTMGGDGVIHYEGGQHISAYGNANHPALQAFYDAQVHPDMYQLYDDVLDSLREWGSELTLAFTLGGGNSRYGSWGHLPRVDSTPTLNYSPKYLALRDNMLQDPVPDLGADTSLCPGNTLLLDAGNHVTYSWNTGDSLSTVAVGPGSYAVTVTDQHQCHGSDSIMVGQFPAPVPQLGADTLLCLGEILLLDPGNFSGYAWNTGATGAQLQVDSTGNYSVIVTDGNGCTGGDTITVTFDVCTALLPDQQGSISLWPNPSPGILNFSVAIPNQGPLEIEVWNAGGKRLSREIFKQETGQLDLSSHPAGLYLIRLNHGGKVTTQRILLQ